MELSEAIRVLNDWNKAEEWTIKDPDYRHKDVYIERKEAIETVLRELESARKFIEEEEETIVEKNNKICELEYKVDNSIHKDKINEKIEELRAKLEDVSNHREKAKEKEEQAVLWCLEIRLDEQIKTYKELLKGE